MCKSCKKRDCYRPLSHHRSPSLLFSAERQAELARKFSTGKPLSEIIIEEREDRV